MMRFFFARSLLAALLWAGVSTPLQAAGTLTLCFENKMLMPWHSAERDGLNFELFKRVEAKLELTFVYETLPWKRCLARLKANEVDGAFAVSFSEDRRQFGAFPGNEQPDVKKRMQYARYFLVRKKGSSIDWDGKRFASVDGKIAFQLGYSIGELLNAHKVAVDESSDPPFTVGRKLVAGMIAGAAMMDSDVSTLMRTPLAPQLEVVATPLTEKAYYLILSNELVKAKPELAEQIWKAIEEVRNSKEYGKLVQAAGVENAR
ncbi:MAG: transporter substrate-binding domain-containing protein [Pseudomonadota bacterium]